MEICSPLCITSRLRPGCRIGGAEISIEYSSRLADMGRQRYHWYIDKRENLDGVKNTQEFEDDELCSGSGGGSLQEGLESLLCFLGAFAEVNYQNCNPDSENVNLFPAGLADWAIENADGIETMELDLHENPGKLIVE